MGIRNNRAKAEERLDDSEVQDMLGAFGDPFEDEDDESLEGLDRGDDAMFNQETDDDDDLEVSNDSSDEDAEDDSEDEPEDEPEDESDEETAEEEEGDESEDAEPEKDEADSADEPEVDSDDKDEKPRDGNYIPRSRLNKEIRKRRELEAEVEAMRSGQRKAEEQEPRDNQSDEQRTEQAKIDTANVQSALEKVLDGDVDSATEALVGVLQELNGNNNQPREVSQEQISQYVEQKFESDKLMERAQEHIKSYDFLNEESDETFDSDAANEVIELRDFYIQRGQRPVEALDKAVTTVARDYGYETAGRDEAPAEKAPAKKEPKLRKPDVKKKVDMANKNPGRVPQSNSSQRQRKVNLSTASETDFESASTDALRRARGDFI